MSHGHAHADAHDPFQKRVAVAMAIYTVVVAFNTMLTNQARTRALLLSNEATNKWAYFQSKSTKAALIRATRDIVAQLPEKAPAVRPAAFVEQKEAEGQAGAGVLEKLKAEGERYEKEKEEIKAEAEKVVEQGEHQQHLEHFFEYATTIAELALVFASVALLLTSKPAFLASMAFAGVSLALTAWTHLH